VKEPIVLRTAATDAQVVVNAINSPLLRGTDYNEDYPGIFVLVPAPIITSGDTSSGLILGTGIPGAVLTPYKGPDAELSFTIPSDGIWGWIAGSDGMYRFRQTIAGQTSGLSSAVTVIVDLGP
jgi:hypothetical protein